MPEAFYYVRVDATGTSARISVHGPDGEYCHWNTCRPKRVVKLRAKAERSARWLNARRAAIVEALNAQS